MSFDCVVFDFDGTLTDPGAVLEALQRATHAELAARLGLTIDRARALWADAAQVIDTAPASAGWEYEGHVVASLKADPYVSTNMVTLQAVTQARRGATREELDREVVAIHLATHHANPAPFRPEAKHVLDALIEAGKHVAVVTNSDGQTVNRRLDELGLQHRERLHMQGHAWKFVITQPAQRADAFEALPEFSRAAGLDRPVMLRRGRYFEKLASVWSACGASPSTTMVCGDIYEIDLAMPAALGCAVQLVLRPDTLDWEREAVAALPAGRTCEALEDIVDRASYP